MGLLPSEILELDWSDIDLDFGVVTVAKGSTKRVLRLDGALKELLFGIKNDNSQGLILSKAFTRQCCISRFNLMLVDAAYRG